MTLSALDVRRTSARLPVPLSLGTLLGLLGMVLASLGTAVAHAQDPRAIVREAASTEVARNREDHSRWRYRDEQRDRNQVSNVVQTDAGTVKRLIERGGHPLGSAEAAAEETRLQAYIRDRDKLDRQHKDSASDDKQAEEFLNMLPTAFIWRLESETGDAYTLHFDPDPSFHPPDLQSRVLGALSGTLVVDKQQHRIRTISGRLVQDVTIGFGLLGRLKGGGIFDVERRQVAPGLWQITETHVHIEGKALLFKSIGQQQDEVQTNFRQLPGSTSLEAAVEMSKPGQ